MTALTWVIIATQSGTEETRAQWLREHGYRAYVPSIRRIVFPQGRKNRAHPRMVPMLPGYLFAEDWSGWPDVVENGHAARLMRLLADRSGNLAKLCDADIDALRRIEHEHDEPWPRKVGRPRTDIDPGDAVRFPFDESGSLHPGTLVRLSPNGRAVIEAMLFGRSTMFDIDASLIVSA